MRCGSWQADTETVQTVRVVTGDTSTVTFTNKELPGMRIIKYDRGNYEAMAGITFRLARIEDGNRYLDRTTSSTGEIVWAGLEPGVYFL